MKLNSVMLDFSSEIHIIVEFDTRLNDYKDLEVLQSLTTRRVLDTKSLYKQ